MAHDLQSMESEPNDPRVADPLQRFRRRRLLGWVFKIVIAMLVLVAAGLIYLQSEHALRHVIAPRIGRALNTQLDFNAGNVSYGGVLQFQNVSLQGSDGQPAFSARQFYVRVDPRLLLAGQLVVREARLAGAQLRYTLDERGRGNWDFIQDRNSRAPKVDEPHQSAAEFPQVHVDQLAIDNMELLYEDGKGLVYHIQPLNVKASSLARGSAGQLELALVGTGTQAKAGVTQNLNLKFNGTLKQGPAGELLDWVGQLASEVAQTRARAGGTSETQQVRLSGTTQGSMQRNGSTSASLGLHAATPSGSVGDIDGRVAWQPGGARSINFELRNIGRDALNPLLVTAGALQLESARIEGKGELRGEGDRLRLALTLEGRGLSFKRAQADPTAPMDLNVRQNLDYDLKSRRLRIEQLDTQISQQGRLLIVTTLNKPAEIELNAGSQALNQAGAQLAIEVNDVGWNDLKPWLMLLGSRDRQLLTAGRFNGKVVVDLTRGGRTLAVDGRLQATALRPAFLDSAPLTLNPEFKGTLTDFNTLEIAQAETSLRAGGEPLATAGFKGQYQLAGKRAQFDIDLSTDRLTELADTLNGSADLPGTVSGGRLHTTQQLTLDAAKQVIGLEGRLVLSDLALKLASGSTPLGAQGDLKLTLDQVRQLLSIDHSNLTITGVGDTGVVDLSGNWPLGASPSPGRAGNLKLSLKHFDAAPWLALLGMLNAEPLPSLPLEADEEVTLAGDALRVKGLAKVGLPPGDAPTAQGVQTVEVTHMLEKAGNRLASLLLDLKGPDATLSALKVEGGGWLGSPTRLDLKAAGGTLDLDALLARIDAILGKSPANAANGSSPETTAARERPDAIYDTQLAVERLVWRGQDLREAKVRARFENGVWTINVDQSLLNGGPFKGQYSYDGYRSEPRMAWDLNAERTPIDKLVAIGNPEAAKKISGLGTLQTRGSGEGRGDRFKQSLQGDTQFKIVDGEVRENRFLDALADQTLLGSFRNVKFFDFSGGLNMNNNRIDFDQCLLRGPLHRIDVKGWVSLDGKFLVSLIPAVGQDMVGGIADKLMIPKMVKDVAGFYQFPFGVTVRGEPGKFIVVPRVDSPIQVGGVAGKVTEGVFQGVNQGVNTAAEVGKDVVGGAFRGTGKAINTITGRNRREGEVVTSNSSESAASRAAAQPIADNQTTSAPRSLVGSTKDAVGGAAGKVSRGVEDVFRGIGGALKK